MGPATREGALLNEARSLAERVGTKLRSARATIATAESCTGGLVASLLTDIAGSSDYVLGGVVSYSNEVKHSLLGVPQDLLARHGAVSEPVARAMAEGARRRLDADFAVAITGIAGPTGGTPEKPVGLVFVGLAGPSGTEVERFVWSGSRVENKAESALHALRLLDRALDAQATRE